LIHELNQLVVDLGFRVNFGGLWVEVPCIMVLHRFLRLYALISAYLSVTHQELELTLIPSQDALFVILVNRDLLVLLCDPAYLLL